MNITYRLDLVRARQLRHAVGDYSHVNKLLDYGGNRGNLIEDGNLTGSQYVNLDVDTEALDLCRANFPDSTCLFYDRYNPVYNPTGIPFLPFPFDDNTVDLTFSYSVNTHSSHEDFIFDIAEMTRVTRGPVVV